MRDPLRRSRPRRPDWRATYGPSLWRIFVLLVFLVALAVLRRPCSEGVARFIGDFGEPGGRVEGTDGGVTRGSPQRPTSAPASGPSGQAGPAGAGATPPASRGAPAAAAR